MTYTDLTILKLNTMGSNISINTGNVVTEVLCNCFEVYPV